jgi:hypothetical protein
MSTKSYRKVVEKLLFDGIFSGYDMLANELRVSEADLRRWLTDEGGNELPDLVKFKILALTGVSNLKVAIETVTSDREFQPRADEILDESTGSIRWLNALESLKRSAGFIEDKDLAAYLKVPPSTLSDFRRGKAEISGRIKLKLLDHLGFHSIVSGMEYLLRDETAAAVKRARQRQARKIADNNRTDSTG